MSDQPENVTDDLGSYSVDDEDQLQPEDTLEQDPADVLDAGYSPPDRLHGSLAHGVTAEEQARDETIEERIHQEVPEEGTAYGAPDNESGLDPEVRVGGDDPDSIAASDDWLGDDDSDERVGRLVAPDEGLSGDEEKDLVGEDVGVDGAGASAEEAAMHVVGEDENMVDDGFGDGSDVG